MGLRVPTVLVGSVHPSFVYVTQRVPDAGEQWLLKEGDFVVGTRTTGTTDTISPGALVDSQGRNVVPDAIIKANGVAFAFGPFVNDGWRNAAGLITLNGFDSLTLLCYVRPPIGWFKQ